jgi:hypothetical protein
MEVFLDYDFELHYHPGKENTVADALNRKEIVNLLRVRSMRIDV